MAEAADDPYSDVALVFAGFLCQRCPAELLKLPDWRPADPAADEWQAFGQLGREAGWRVEWQPDRNDWLVLCPGCAEGGRA